MDCLQCQAHNPGDAVFCENCGSQLEVACPNCSGANRLGAKFCKKCGQRLIEAVAAAPVTEGKFGSVEAYTPRYLAEKILISKSALEGERKQVTVLFADLKGSMELLADRDPEEGRKILRPVLEHMMEAVHRYEGTVNNLMGDGIMALFGAPVAHEDHAVRACYAALRMQESVNRYAEGLLGTGVPIQIRVGVNSGEVLVGAIGNELKMDYTAIGQTVHLASRMEQMARPGSVLITAEALRLAEGYIQVKPLGPVGIKGLPEPVDAFEVIGGGTARSRFQAAASRGLTRFIGRDAETEPLHKALEQARGGHGQVVAVVGEPGLGKSRLFFEFIHSQGTQGCLILEGGAVSYGKSTPYLPVISLLKAYFRIQNRDDHREIRDKVTERLLTLDKSLESTLPAFLALLDVPVDDAMWQAFDPSQRRRLTLSAVKRLLLRESQLQPLILLFEDLHWIDSGTQAMLDSFVESLPTSRLLVLVSYRPEYQDGWANKIYYMELRLDPLPPESAREILNSVMGSDHGLEPLKQLLIERTEGNPFYLEESVRTLAETKVLTGEWGNYHLQKKVESTQVPTTVQAVLAARMDRLPLREKQLLQSAAVIGKDVPNSLLQAITELSDEELVRGLTRLQRAEFLYETSLFPDLVYTFKHALTQEVAYGSLPRESRRAFHSRIVEAIEALYSVRLTEQIERLAYHAVQGEVWGKALTYLRQADARSALREAASYFEQALTALTHLPNDLEICEQAIDLHFNLRISLAALREHEKVLEHLRAAEALAGILGDQPRLAQVNTYIAGELLAQGEYEQAVTACERALSRAKPVDDYRSGVMATLFIGQAYYFLGNYSKAVDALRHNLVSLDNPIVRERFGSTGLPFAFSRRSLAVALAEQGDFSEAVERSREANHIAEAVGHPFSVTMTYRGMGHVQLRQGYFQEASLTLEHALKVCQEVDSRPLFHAVSSALGYAYALSGRSAEAIYLLEEAVERPVLTGSQEGQSLRGIWLSEAFLLASRIGDAREAVQRALGLARQHKERGHEAYSFRLLGEIAACEDPLDIGNAEDHYRQALALAEELGMRPLIAHCQVDLGRLYRRSGDLRLAKEHLNDGVAMMRQMGMGLWLEKAEAEFNGLGGSC